MLDTLRSLIQYLIPCACLVTCFACADEEDRSTATLPADFYYEGKPIHETYLEEWLSPGLFRYLSEDEMMISLSEAVKEPDSVEQSDIDEEDFLWSNNEEIFEWNYLGAVPGGHHILRAYCWPRGAMGKFTAFFIVHRDGDRLVISDIIEGGDRHSSSIYGLKVEGNKVVYRRGASMAGFVERALTMFPELQPLYDRSSKTGLCYGEAGFMGVYEMAATISDKGEVLSDEVLMFYPAEGGEGSDTTPVKPAGIKAYALEMLRDIDRDKPDEFKENGIAYSPELFKKLLEADLKGDDHRPKVVDISEFKDVPYAYYFSSYNWGHIAKIGDYHLVYISMHDLSWDADYFSGIYTVKKEGNQLRKVGRIARQVGRNCEITTGHYYGCNSFSTDTSSVDYQHDITPRALWTALMEMYPEYADTAGERDMTGVDDRDTCGSFVWKAEIAADGTLKGRSFVAYRPYVRVDYDEAKLALKQKDALSLKEAMQCVAKVMQHEDKSEAYSINGVDGLKEMFVQVLKHSAPKK